MYLRLALVATNLFWGFQASCGHLRGLSVVNDNVAWMSGSGGTVLRTSDGGTTWDTLNPQGYSDRDFRDIHAWNEKRAIVLSSGDSGVVLYTRDGGRHWKTVFADNRSGVFFDAIDVNGRQIILLGDGMEDANPYIAGGSKPKHMKLYRIEFSTAFNADLHRPEPATDEHIHSAKLNFTAFAASGSNIFFDKRRSGSAFAVVSGNDTAWFVQITISSKKQKALLDKPNPLPLLTGAASGAYSLGISGNHMIAVGGTYLKPEDPDKTGAFSTDGGNTWQPCQTMPNGYRSCVYHLPETNFWFCTGTNGTDFSADNGANWEETALEGYNVLASSAHYLWMAGNKGSWRRVHFSQILP